MRGGKRDLQELKGLLGIKDDGMDMQLGFALRNADEAIKNYCNIDSVPEGLASTRIRMAMDIYRNEQPGDGNVPLAVKSITTGDTSTSFGAAATAGYEGTVLKDYKKQLNRYRKVVF